MKRKLLALTLSALMITGLVGCSKTEEKKEMKVGMVTDSGTIDDESFNQGTWQGIEKAEKELGIDKNYLKPAGTTEADYLKEIANLYDNDYKFIVTPGFKFETAILQAQDKYEDAKFVLIDGLPNNGKFDATRVEKVGDNTVSIFFAEHEAGYLAGVATALELKEGALGFIGGMKIAPVQKFNWGFQQGVKYANENLGTKMTISPDHVKYQGTFDNTAAGKQLAAVMYDDGVKAIFTAAGGVGVGAIKEAQERAEAGKEAWIIGVDVDQYSKGIYKDGKSVILTSAMKQIDTATFDVIKAELDGNFPGGKTLVFDAKNNGIGIPAENPNLSKETSDKVAELFTQIKEGKIVVSSEQGSLVE